MKDKKIFIITIVCALCTFGAQNARAQKMYMDNNMLILDCGPNSGFPQSIVETQTGKKATINSDNNYVNGIQNKTVYQKLEIEQSDNTTGINWTNAYTACTDKNKDDVTGWRLPTQREMQLISIFGPAIKTLTGKTNDLPACWALTELSGSGSDYSAGWYVRPDGYSAATPKTNTAAASQNISYRCVREILVGNSPIAADL